MTPQDILERWAAGDWKDDPDGGVCRAIMLAYWAGIYKGEQDSKLGNPEQPKTPGKRVVCSCSGPWHTAMPECTGPFHEE